MNPFRRCLTAISERSPPFQLRLAAGYVIQRNASPSAALAGSWIGISSRTNHISGDTDSRRSSGLRTAREALFIIRTGKPFVRVTSQNRRATRLHGVVGCFPESSAEDGGFAPELAPPGRVRSCCRKASS